MARSKSWNGASCRFSTCRKTRGERSAHERRRWYVSNYRCRVSVTRSSESIGKRSTHADGCPHHVVGHGQRQDAGPVADDRLDDLGVDLGQLIGEAINQGGIAYDVDQPRYPAGRLVNQLECIGREEIAAAARNVETM